MRADRPRGSGQGPPPSDPRHRPARSSPNCLDMMPETAGHFQSISGRGVENILARGEKGLAGIAPRRSNEGMAKFQHGASKRSLA